MTDNKPDYEPIYFSKQHEWKNATNFGNGKLERRKTDLKFTKDLIHENIERLMESGIDKSVIRQVLVAWVYETTFYDQELHDFDKKVGVDTRALIAEKISNNTG